MIKKWKSKKKHPVCYNSFYHFIGFILTDYDIDYSVIFERFGAILNVCVTVMLDVLKEDNGVKFE